MVENISHLAHRIEHIQTALDAGEGRVAPETLEYGWQILDRSFSRGQLSTEHTVIGFFGATGSGKSSLFNAVIGRELAATAVRRPTTSRVQAAVWGETGSETLLNWLDVDPGNRVYPVPDDTGAPALNSAEISVHGGIWNRLRSMVGKEKTELHSGGLILLDLPDFDSVATANRATVEKMVGFVDVLVWVFDPQKYADSVIHRDFIEPLAEHGAVTLAVLNQSDRLHPDEIPSVLGSLKTLLAQDGLTTTMLAAPMAVSARTGDGIDRLRTVLSRVAVEKMAAVQRIEADLDTVVAELADQDGAGIPDGVTGTASRLLIRDLYTAVGADTVVHAAGESYRLHAAGSTGWIPTRWLLTLRRDPLKRLNLYRKDRDRKTDIARSSLPPLGAGQISALSAALRRFAGHCAEGVGEPWNRSIREAARSEESALPAALERAIARADFRAHKKIWWWQGINILQWVSFLSACLGLLWLSAFALAGYFHVAIPQPQPVGHTTLPLPTLLVIIGLCTGIVAATFGRLCAVGGRHLYRRKIETNIKENIGMVAENTVVAPVHTELERHRAYCEALENAR